MSHKKIKLHNLTDKNVLARTRRGGWDYVRQAWQGGGGLPRVKVLSRLLVEWKTSIKDVDQG